MKLIGIFWFICGLVIAFGHDSCPSGENWSEIKKICWRESSEKMTFHEATHYCNHGKGSLIPVGQLRNLRNRFDIRGHEGLKVHLDNNLYLVNGFKSKNGEWREFQSKRSIPLHHFPKFQGQKGYPGDVLVWDPHGNQLLIADRNDRHHSLCFRHAQDKGLHKCPGYHSRNICNDAGDCHHDYCECDVGFHGKACQLNERYDVDLFIAGGLFSPYGNNSAIYNFQTNTSCPVESIPVSFGQGYSAFFDGRVHYCDPISKQCNVYHKILKKWLAVASLPRQQLGGFALLLPNQHSRSRHIHVPGLGYSWPEDVMWWSTGGLESVNEGESGVPTAATYLYQKKNWRRAFHHQREINLPGGVPIVAYCLTRINDEETALIGGVDPNTNIIVKNIYIYNWKKNTWRVGPVIPTVNVTYPGFERIKDPNTGRWLVMVAGGANNDDQTVFVTSVWFWDPENGQITTGPSIPLRTGFLGIPRLNSYTEYEIIFVSSQLLMGPTGYSGFYKFSIEMGWTNLGLLTHDSFHPNGIIVPKGTFQCL